MSGHSTVRDLSNAVVQRRYRTSSTTPVKGAVSCQTTPEVA